MILFYTILKTDRYSFFYSRYIDSSSLSFKFSKVKCKTLAIIQRVHCWFFLSKSKLVHSKLCDIKLFFRFNDTRYKKRKNIFKRCNKKKDIIAS